MNIKSLRKSYENLTMLERLSLVDNAISREDEIEVKAIVAASPRKTFSQPDYLDLFEMIKKFRFCNLIVRFGCVMNFDYFFHCEFSDEERQTNDARLAAYLYVRATDAWKAVNDELCLRPDYNKEIGEILFPVELLNRKDELLRAFAFTEDEARKFIKKQTGIEKIQTLADEINAIREALGLPEK